MEKEIKNQLPEGLEIADYNGEGYDRTLVYNTWCVAFLNYADRFDKITYLERHLLTDEVFVLLQGTAELLIGKKSETVKMEPFKIYNVKAGVWHAIRVSRDAKVLIVENSDTTKENSEYLYL